MISGFYWIISIRLYQILFDWVRWALCGVLVWRVDTYVHIHNHTHIVASIADKNVIMCWGAKYMFRRNTKLISVTVCMWVPDVVAQRMPF